MQGELLEVMIVLLCLLKKNCYWNQDGINVGIAFFEVVNLKSDLIKRFVSRTMKDSEGFVQQLNCIAPKNHWRCAH